jgi:hypothetical protein
MSFQMLLQEIQVLNSWYSLDEIEVNYSTFSSYTFRILWTFAHKLFDEMYNKQNFKKVEY